MSVNGDTVVSIGCDYLTLTKKESDATCQLHWLASGIFRHQSELGHKPRPWSGHLFKGWQCGSVQISKREDELMVRVWSDSAFLNWKRLVSLADNITRFDTQATIMKLGPVGPTIDKHRNQARRHSNRHQRKPVVQWIQDNRDAYTLYLGARQSKVFGRIYDKGVREKVPEFQNCVRYEVQFQEELARIVARTCASLDSPIPRIASYTSRFFEARDVPLKLPHDDKATYCCSRTRSDLEKNLQWLKAAVRPCVLRLIDAGRGEEAIRALGLVQDSGPELGPQLDQHNTEKE